MWYLIQASIAGYIGYYWTTLPGNSPINFGHGLFLGILIAWFVTTIVYATLDLFIRQIRRIQNNKSLARLSDRRGEKHPGNQVGIGSRTSSRSPRLIP